MTPLCYQKVLKSCGRNYLKPRVSVGGGKHQHHQEQLCYQTNMFWLC